MTFKHINFEDSAIMRSLEKVAIDKKLVKAEVIKKEASKRLDLEPSDNFIDNIMKLCNGLRANGLSKYANELEEKFMVYKRAEHLYETSKETGDDVINSAHPSGSHKLEGVDGDSVIETILEQQLKDIKMIEKTPTGKLSTSSEIIKSVKKCLGQERVGVSEPAEGTVTSQNLLVDVNQQKQYLNNQKIKAINYITQAQSVAIVFATEIKKYLSFIVGDSHDSALTEISESIKNNVSSAKIQQYINNLIELNNRTKPSEHWYEWGVSDTDKSKYMELYHSNLAPALSLSKKALQIMQVVEMQENELNKRLGEEATQRITQQLEQQVNMDASTKTQTTSNQQVSEIDKKIKTYIRRANSWKQIVNDYYPDQATKNDGLSQINRIVGGFRQALKLPDAQKTPKYKQMLAEYKAFNADWIAPTKSL